MALNILALILVLAFLAGSMWAYNRYVHRRKKQAELLDGDFETSWETAEVPPECPECKGTGAKNKLGSIIACVSCEGTGVVSSASLDS